VVAVVSIQLSPWILGDLSIYDVWIGVLRQGSFPSDDPMWQYPPAAGPVVMAAAVLPGTYAQSFVALMAMVDLAVLVALLVAHARTRGASWRGPLLWAAAGVIVGPILLTRFDLVPTLFAVIAVLLARRPVWSGVSAGIGALVKLWPALMLIALPRRALGRGALGFALTVIALGLALSAVFSGALSFASNQGARGLQVESVGALPFVAYSAFSDTVRFRYEYGSVQVAVSGAMWVGTALTIAGLAVLLVVAWWRLSGRIDDVLPSDLALTAMLVSIAASRVYSPQFNVWLVGLAAVALLARATRLTAVVVLVVGVTVVTQVVYPWSVTELVDGDLGAIAAQTARILGLLTATCLAVWRIRPRRPAPNLPRGLPSAQEG
jgi:hypothetical protein